MADTTADVQQLARIVAGDHQLPRDARREAAVLAGLARRQPGRAREGLERLRERLLPDLVLHMPACDYGRCVSVETFWRHHLRPDRKQYFGPGHRSYLAHLRSQRDPAATAHADLSHAPVVVPADYSWLVPLQQIVGVDGPTLVRRLQLRGSSPPFLIFVFPEDRLRHEGVTVREPRGVDAVPAKLLQWTPGGVPNERIDRDIPLAALGRLEWRP